MRRNSLDRSFRYIHRCYPRQLATEHAPMHLASIVSPISLSAKRTQSSSPFLSSCFFQASFVQSIRYPTRNAKSSTHTSFKQIAICRKSLGLNAIQQRLCKKTVKGELKNYLMRSRGLKLLSAVPKSFYRATSWTRFLGRSSLRCCSCQCLSFLCIAFACSRLSNVSSVSLCLASPWLVCPNPCHL